MSAPAKGIGWKASREPLNGRAVQPPKILPTTDVANGERFATDHGDVVRFCHKWGKWFTWTGRQWREDESGEVWRLAKDSAKRIYIEAAVADDADCRAITNHATASQSRSRLLAMLDLAKSEHPIPIDHTAFDADGWLLNFNNVTVDLRDGSARPHDSGDLITKTCGYDYPTESGDEPVLWLEFLTEIFAGDDKLIRYVQKLFGYALVGVVREHVLPIHHGSGSNGKSVLASTALAAFGDYGLAAPPGFLMDKRNDRHPTELADLFGRRLVILSESKDGQRLDEGLVKLVTGGDRLRARHLHQDFWEFSPSHTAMLLSNHLPVIKGVDVGVWRRVRKIPYEVTIPPKRQDDKLAEKLRAELPVIAKWMVDGCLAWQKEKLTPPAKVLLATEGYKQDSDTFAQWFDERCLTGEQHEAKASAVFTDYKAWCERSNERPLTQTAFGLRVVEKPFTKERRRDGFWYFGFCLQASSYGEA